MNKKNGVKVKHEGFLQFPMVSDFGMCESWREAAAG